MFQTKEGDKTSEEELSEVDIGILPKKEFQPPAFNLSQHQGLFK